MSLKLTVANCKNRLCPWAKSKVKRNSLAVYRDSVVGFATPDYRDKFITATTHFDTFVTLDTTLKPGKHTTASTITANSHCPWSNKKVSNDSLTQYLNLKVGFCNPGCRDMFSTAIDVFDSSINESLSGKDLKDKNPEPSRKKLKVSQVNKLKVEDTNCATIEDSHRCGWAKDPVFHEYHDTEWGVPCREDDRYLFEMLILEGAQAGLSWKTILNKRQSYKEAFDNFDIATVAEYDEEKVISLLENPGIVRNKLKVRSAITNAKATLKICEEFGSFSTYIWSFVDHSPIVNSPSMSSMLVTSPESDALSKDLKKRGFKFVGSTIMYAYMQAVGMVDDHESTCKSKPS